MRLRPFHGDLFTDVRARPGATVAAEKRASFPFMLIEGATRETPAPLCTTTGPDGLCRGGASRSGTPTRRTFVVCAGPLHPSPPRGDLPRRTVGHRRAQVGKVER